MTVLVSPIEIELARSSAQFEPGETVSGRFVVPEGVGPLERVEAALVWYTEGKGDTDREVASYQHSIAFQTEDGRREGQFAIALPLAPHSYEGQVVQVRWALRLNFHIGGEHGDASFDLPLTVGRVRSPTEWKPT